MQNAIVAWQNVKNARVEQEKDMKKPRAHHYGIAFGK